MKTKNYLAVLAAGFILLTGCSTPVHVQHDDSASLGNYHTYAWVDTKANENDNSSRATAYADISVRNAANKALAKKGWREVKNEANADALLSYDVLVHRTTEQRSDPVYTQPFSRMYYNPYRRRWVSIYYPTQLAGYDNYEVPVKEGVITISILDANTDKPVWQAWTTEELNYSRLTDEEIQGSVSRILNKFKPA
jgi:hypothetical protein